MKTECLIDILKEKKYIQDVNISKSKENKDIIAIEYICESKDVIDKIRNTFENENKNHCIISDEGINNQISLVDINALITSMDIQLQEKTKNDIDKIRKENYKIILRFKDFSHTKLNQQKFIDAMNSIQNDYKIEKYVDHYINSNREETDIRVTLLKQKEIDNQEKKQKQLEMKQFVESLP